MFSQLSMSRCGFKVWVFEDQCFPRVSKNLLGRKCVFRIEKGCFGAWSPGHLPAAAPAWHIGIQTESYRNHPIGGDLVSFAIVLVWRRVGAVRSCACPSARTLHHAGVYDHVCPSPPPPLSTRTMDQARHLHSRRRLATGVSRLVLTPLALSLRLMLLWKH